MKKFMNLSKLAIAALVTSGLFVACSEEISENTVDTQYTAKTGNISNAGQAVDLGLDSGTLWANMNVGASSETDPGILFIWGDITGKKIDADHGATYTNVVDKTSFDVFFNSKKWWEGEETDGVLSCDTTLITQTSQPKLIGTSDMTPREKKEAILEYLKDKLDEYKGSSTGEGFLEATLINDGSCLVIMRMKEGEYFERIPDLATMYGRNPDKGDPVTPEDSLKYYDSYKYEKLTSVTINGIKETSANYYVTQADKKWDNGFVNDYEHHWTAITDLVGQTVYSDYNGHTFGNSTKDIQGLDPTEIYPEKPTDESRYKIYGYEFFPVYDIKGDAKYDAATANWGNDWRMPTTFELAELYLYCTWEFVGNGYKVTGPNGNSIFLPAAGYRYGDKQYGNGNAGYYASGEILGTYTFPSFRAQSNGSKGDYPSIENMPSVLIFQHGQYNAINVYDNMSATYGFSIRPVKIVVNK